MNGEMLLRAARHFGTPLYVYDANELRNRFAALSELLGSDFSVSYAVKANPNRALLKEIELHVATFDVSSYKEFERVREIGCVPDRITFSGPAKRPEELRAAIGQGLGELVVESVGEALQADAIAAEFGRHQKILIRINPATAPKRFGVSFAGRASQFGIDEEELDDAIDRIMCLAHLDLAGFHIFSGTNSLDVQAIAANFAIFGELFRRAVRRANISPRKLIFGSGFGLAYGPSDQPLDLAQLSQLLLPQIRALKAEPRFANAQYVLEMGRWLMGPAGWLLTRVLAEKTSRGVEYRLCDAGFNNQLAACGMMGTVIRRNWRITNLSNREGALRNYTLAGPLCTSIDLLASDIGLPELHTGDILAVENSGAYGLTASPTRFISHPEPKEVLVLDERLQEVTESAANHWTAVDGTGRPLAGNVTLTPLRA